MKMGQLFVNSFTLRYCSLKLSLSLHKQIKSAAFEGQDRYCIISSDWCIISSVVTVPWSPEVFNSPRQILTLLNKVPGYWLQGETDLANMPRNMQIFPHSKFGINRTAGLKVMAKKFLRLKLYFLAITYKPAVQLIPNFECGKICMFFGLFAN